MKIIDTHVKVIDSPSTESVLRKLNRSARKCYQSEPVGPDEKLIANVIKSGHTSVLEHVSFTFDIITDRSVLAELTRHRMAGYSVESTRYVKYENNMEFIKPVTIMENDELFKLWHEGCVNSENTYKAMMKVRKNPSEARQVLNNSLKVEIRMTANVRSLRNMLYLRCDKPAHPHIKMVAIPILLGLKEKYPVIFDNLRYEFDNADGMEKDKSRYEYDYDKEFYDKYIQDYHKYISFENTDENVNVKDVIKTKKLELVEE